MKKHSSIKSEKLQSDYDMLAEEVTQIRRNLHMHPEKGFAEHKTSKFIADYLEALGITVMQGIAGTGVIGILKGNPGTNSIAIRSDMDCLEVTENTGADFCSRVSGLMHACGHDGHMAAVLGLARLLSSSKNAYKKNILFVFQPAEEGPGGAKPFVESGTLDSFNIEAFLALHIYPEIEQGRIGCCFGPVTARNGEVDIKITGKSCHGALPHTGVDSVVAASQVIQAVQSIISRRIDPRESGVITIGKIYGGEARNILAGQVVLEGTIRAFSEEVYNTIKHNITNICKGVEITDQCSIDSDIRDMYPEVYNDSNLYDIFIDAAGIENVEVMKPLMIAEDFSYYRKIAPELMFFLGSRNSDEGFIHPLHNSEFNFDENILMQGICIYYNMIHVLDEKDKIKLKLYKPH